MEGLTQKNRNVWLKNEKNRLGKVGRTDSKNGKDWLKKWKDWLKKWEGLNQNREGPIPKQADLTRKKHLAAIIKKIIKAKSHFLFHKFISTTKTFYCIIEFHPPPFPFLFCFVYFFLIRVFLHRHWRFTGQQGKGGPIFLSTTSTRSKTFRHLFATLLGRWPSRIFNCNASIYQTATQ